LIDKGRRAADDEPEPLLLTARRVGENRYDRLQQNQEEERESDAQDGERRAALVAKRVLEDETAESQICSFDGASSPANA